jgi:ankyrin repeat protein
VTYALPDTVRPLLANGANVNCQDKKGRMPLRDCGHHLQSLNRFFDIAEMLLEGGALPDTPDNNKVMCLHEAAMYGGSKMISLLLSHGASVNARDRHGYTPFTSPV